MKILILDHYYEKYLSKFYVDHPEVGLLCFEDHRRLLMCQRFGTFDAYSYYLEQNGCDAEEIVVNDDLLQLKWAHENGMKVKAMPLKLTKLGNRLLGVDWRFRILKAQIESFKPDVLFVQERNILTDRFVSEIKPFVKLVVCQIASPIPSWRSFKSVDLVLSSLPHFVAHFRNQGLRAEYLPLCFDERLLDEIKVQDKKYDITFVGGISKPHTSRTRVLEEVSRHIPIDWFGYGAGHLNKNSPLSKKYHGEIFGKAMYEILAQSRITINSHIDIAGDYANNMRLFEATGIGACLVTDAKTNLADFFESDREVGTYKTASELVAKLIYLTDHPKEVESIAKAGQSRTLRQHSYSQRIPQLTKILSEALKKN